MIRQFIVADTAYLRAKPDEGVFLCLGSLAYAANDAVPLQLLARHELPTGSTAAWFVAEIMKRRFGTTREDWPALALQFLKPAVDTHV